MGNRTGVTSEAGTGYSLVPMIGSPVIGGVRLASH